MNCALTFVGQGAQVVGMGKDLAETYPECAALYRSADETLGCKLSEVCFNGPEQYLTRTDVCQPAIFVTSAVCLKALEMRVGPLKPVGAGGLSLGEWTALYAAGALSFEDTLKALEARGRFMQQACENTRGGMISIMGLDPEQVATVARETGVSISNINSPDQIVLSGEAERISAAAERATAAGARRAVSLAVAGAYHSPLMKDAADRLAAVLDTVTFSKPAFPVVSNVTGELHGSSAAIRQAMLDQIVGTVRWVDCVHRLARLGADTMIELGPGSVLSVLLRRIDRGLNAIGVQNVASLDKLAESWS